MELPDDIILLVKEFSRPVTRADWRTLRRLEEIRLLWHIGSLYNTKRIPVIERFVPNYNSDTSNYMCLFRAGFIVNIIKN